MSIVRIPAGNPGPYTGEGNNTYLVNGREPTLIDAGVGHADHLSALEGALGGLDLARLIVTHGHSDHIEGTRALRNRWPGLALCKVPWPESDVTYWPDWQSVSDGDHVPAGDGLLRVMHTPGHSPDHICLLDASSQVLFGGDLLISDGTVIIPASKGGDLRQYLASLRRVAGLEPAVVMVLPAHGPAIERPLDLIAQYIAHREERDRQILAALAFGALDPAAIVRRVYTGLNPALAGAAAESVLAHLIKLAADGRVRCEGGGWVTNVEE